MRSSKIRQQIFIVVREYAKKYLMIYGECANLEWFYIYKFVSEYAKVFCVHGEHA
jgi:hypothetical protein